MKRLSFYLLIFLILISAQLFGAIIYVDIAATGSNNGTSWPNAYTSLASWTPAFGDTVYIKNGAYVGVPTFIALFGYVSPIRIIAVEDSVVFKTTTSWIQGEVDLYIQGCNIQNSTIYFISYSGPPYTMNVYFESCKLGGTYALIYSTKSLTLDNCLAYSIPSTWLHQTTKLVLRNSTIIRNSAGSYIASLRSSDTDTLICENTYLQGNGATTFWRSGYEPFYSEVDYCYFTTIDTAGTKSPGPTFISNDIGVTVSGTFPYWTYSLIFTSLAKGGGMRQEDIGYWGDMGIVFGGRK